MLREWYVLKLIVGSWYRWYAWQAKDAKRKRVWRRGIKDGGDMAPNGARKRMRIRMCSDRADKFIICNEINGRGRRRRRGEIHFP